MVIIYVLLALVGSGSGQDLTTLLTPLVPASVFYQKYADLTIQRFLNVLDTYHYYAVSNSSFPATLNVSLIREEDVGRVLSSTNNANFSSICSTKLISITRYERSSAKLPPVSLFSDKAPSGNFTAKETFYCSPTKDACGANWELTMFPMKEGDASTTGDMFYPSNAGQLSVMKMGFGTWSNNGTTVCYIWK